MLPAVNLQSSAATAPGPSLAAALREAIAGEVHFDDGHRALYASDASNYRQMPVGVVLPRSVDDVIAAVAVCRRFGAAVLPRGAGTSLCGQCCNHAVVIDFTPHVNRVLEIDPARRIARVEPGVVLDDLRSAARRHGLTFAPDPATHNHNTLGGMIGNNSCGPHSVMGGKTDDNVIALDVLTYEGLRLTVGRTTEEECDRICRQKDARGALYRGLRSLRERYADEMRARMPDIPRRVSGYALDALLPENGFHVARALVGSEGTCVTVLAATLRLLPQPAHSALLVLGYEDVYAAAAAVPAVLEHGPIALEGLDDCLADDVRRVDLHAGNLELLPQGRGWLLAEFGGDSPGDAAARAHAAMTALAGTDRPPAMQLYRDPHDQHRVWQVRESGLGATAHVPGKNYTWPGWEDSAVPPARFAEYLRALRALMEEHGYSGDFYGHFGQGCLHTRIDFDLQSAQGIARYRRFAVAAAKLAVAHGGSISGEHGDGQSKAELLPIMYGERLCQAFREFKALWDPQARMNPGKVIDAQPLDSQLRLGAQFTPPQPLTRFAYAEDEGNLTRATLRCVGVGECRKKSGTMCPSYMATGEEMHSTRGRAHLLFEMLRGDTLTRGWREPAVKQALDLCLSCKACKTECPVDVDMATYKAEFLSHYYEGRLRPAVAYAFGLIDRWARIGGAVPRLANALTQPPPLAALARRLLGLAAQRRIPPFAREPFTRGWRRRPVRMDTSRQPEVILWPDTFNNHFEPDIVWAAARVLESAGWRVRIPPAPLCCGRALYEFGMVDRARGYLERILDVMSGDIRAGTPIVGLEPACVSVFREELPNLFPRDEQARRLCAQVFLLSEFLEHRVAEPLAITPLQGDALVHWHCHQRTVLGAADEQRLLGRLGLNLRFPDSGCCGMAGAFGYERHKYDVSMRCAERVLLPSIRKTAADTIVLANGFSCREQIRHGTGRRVLHLAQILERAVA